MIRRAYRTIMHFPGVGDLWVRWFLVPKGTPTLPFPTVYCSRNWRIRQGWPDNIPGEIHGAPRPWVRSKRLHSCKGFKGNAAAWAGLSSTPIDCDPIGNWNGGIELGGEWVLHYLTPIVGAGGGEGNGAGTWGSGWPATGGGEADGEGTWGSGWLASGGGEGDGTGLWGSGWLASGGGEGDGEGLWGSGWESDGGGEGDGEGLWNSPPMIADGGGEGDGEGLWDSPGPGATCAAALPVTLPYTGTFTVPTSGHHWFVFAATSGVRYHVRFSAVSGGAAPSAAVTHNTCASPSPVMVVMMPGCSDAVAGTSDNWMVDVNGSLAGSVTYTIEIDTGAC